MIVRLKDHKRKKKNTTIITQSCQKTFLVGFMIFQLTQNRHFSTATVVFKLHLTVFQ